MLDQAENGLLDVHGQIDRDEPSSGVQVVLVFLIDDANYLMVLGLGVIARVTALSPVRD